MIIRLFKQQFLFLIGCLCAIICCSCISTTNERKLIIEEIIKKSEMKNTYITRSYFAILPKEQRNKFVEIYVEGIANFYIANLSVRELDSLLNFQYEPTIQKFRRTVKTSQRLTDKDIDNIEAVIQQYPVVQKICSKDFQNKMLEYLREHMTKYTKKNK